MPNWRDLAVEFFCARVFGLCLHANVQLYRQDGIGVHFVVKQRLNAEHFARQV